MSWKPVSVELEGGDNEDDTKNHYDNAKLSKKALKDLPVNPGEPVGMFYGLEVCHDYRLQGRSPNPEKKISLPETTKTSKKRQREKESNQANESSSRDTTLSSDQTKKDAKKKKKKDKKSNETSKESVGEKKEKDSSTKAQKAEEPIDQDRFMELQQAWGSVLDPQITESLYRQNFFQPTPIQAASLNAAILGRRNIVGAAPTGSGKTLAFVLPILHHLFMSEKKYTTPQAVIVTPTRELATQIQEECSKLIPNQCVTLVGGVAQVKQARILQTKRPPIIIGTPGRLWAMISSGEHEHLNDLTQIRFLVLDEADRMVQEHCFPQLVSILQAIHEANPREEEEEYESESDDDDDGDRLLRLKGVKGEAKVTMLTDELLEQIQEQRFSTKPERLETPDDDDNDSEDGHSEDGRPKVHRQTFIYSATLTLPFTSLNEKRKQKKTKKHGLDGGILDILERTRSMGETKVVDLSSSSSEVSESRSSSGVRLPPGLVLAQIKCTQMHKDSHLYAYLTTTSQGASGPCLIFCNSIAAVRRVGKTLECLRFSVRILHAQMQQRARFKAVESLKDSTSRAVVVCTDVAARGLDIPSVSTVIHYDVARSVDGFVHRSGRTARGMGEGAVGTSVSLISPAEDKSHSKIVEALEVTFSKVILDGRLMTSAQERSNLASKIVVAGEVEHRTQSHNRWFQEAARDCDLEIDDDLIEDESNMSQKDQVQLKEAQKAKTRLAKLLAEPMKTQRFGKFMSTNSSFMHAEIKPLAGKPSAATKPKKKRNKASSS